ncbi:hypothetical protein [Micromonospora wenchangensis]|uniref:hypothetical protein n=1 Tax=Micromonospora wenchangensis TaxID=1185415 RepID=UPI003D705B3B
MTNISLPANTTQEANAMTFALPARSEPRVEVATNLLTRQDEVIVRNSKDPQGGQIAGNCAALDGLH